MEPLKVKLKTEYFHRKILLESRKQTIDARRNAMLSYSTKQSPQAIKLIIPEILELLKELETTIALKDIHIASNLFRRLDRLISRNFQHNTVIFEKTMEIISLYLEQNELIKRSSVLFANSMEALNNSILGLMMSIIGYFVIDDKEMKSYILNSHVHSLLKLRLLDDSNIDVLNQSIWILSAFIEDDKKFIKRYGLTEYYSIFHHLFKQLKQVFDIESTAIDVKSLKRGSKIVESFISATDVNFNEEMYIELVYDNINEMLMGILRLMDHSDSINPALYDKNFIDVLVYFFMKSQHSLRLNNSFIQVLASYMSDIEHNEIAEYIMITGGCLSALYAKLINPNLQIFIKEKILFTITNSMVNSEKIIIEFINCPNLIQNLSDFIFVYNNERLTTEVVWCLCSMTNFNYVDTYKAFCSKSLDKLILSALTKIARSTDVVSLCLLLDALKNLLDTDQKVGGRLTEEIKNGEIIDILADLQMHKRRKVYDRAYDILTEYFDDMV